MTKSPGKSSNGRQIEIAGFPAVERTRLSDQIAGHLQEAIADGRYKNGERLPSEQELAGSFKASRGTVREALRALQAMGFVDIRTGAGAFVADSPFSVDAMDERLNWLLDRRDVVLEILDVRSALQGLAASKCAQRVHRDEVKALKELLGMQREAVRVENSDAFAQLDASFHSKIGEYCGNQMLRDIIEYVEKVYRASNRALIDMRGRIAQSYKEHGQIVEALASHDEEAAEQAMRNHVNNVRNSIVTLASKGESMSRQSRRAVTTKRVRQT